MGIVLIILGILFIFGGVWLLFGLKWLSFLGNFFPASPQETQTSSDESFNQLQTSLQGSKSPAKQFFALMCFLIGVFTLLFGLSLL